MLFKSYINEALTVAMFELFQVYSLINTNINKPLYLPYSMKRHDKTLIGPFIVALNQWNQSSQTRGMLCNFNYQKKKQLSGKRNAMSERSRLSEVYYLIWRVVHQFIWRLKFQIQKDITGSMWRTLLVHWLRARFKFTTGSSSVDLVVLFHILYLTLRRYLVSEYFKSKHLLPTSLHAFFFTFINP